MPGDMEKFELSRNLDWARFSIVARITADYIREEMGSNAVCAEPIPDILYGFWQGTQVEPTPKSDVARIVLAAFPEPGELTSIEDIVQFRQDPDSRQRLIELRLWVREMARCSSPPSELEEKLEWLLHEYENHMKLHRMKLERGILEIVVTTPLEVLEDLVKLNWSKSAKKLFDLRKSKLALLEAEASAPGREVSYLAWAREKFRRE
jgi:hypothetical protein